MNITLTQVQIYDKNRDGAMLKTKNGKPYKRVAIKCREKGDVWASNNIFDKVSTCFAWKPDQEVDVIFTQNGQWLNWNYPTAATVKKQEEEDRLLAGIKEIYKQNKRILEILDKAFPEEITMEDLKNI